MTKKRDASNLNALLFLLSCVALFIVGTWQIRSKETNIHSVYDTNTSEAAFSVPRHGCQYRGSVPAAVAAAFEDVAAMGSLRAPERTDDHRTEHLREKDANEAAINAMFASLQANLTKQWESSILPMLDAGCNSISFNSLTRATTEAVQSQRSSNSSTSQQQVPGQRTALLLVSDQRSRLQQHLQSYSVQISTLWYYANAHNYALEIYTHNDTLPPNVTGHFVKIQGVKRMFELGYDYVLGLDWDMYITPDNAVPLSLFYNEWPTASIMVQGESNICTGAVLYRNTAAAVQHLQYWWDLALTGCCWKGPLHDQVAFKHMLQAYLARFTGNASMYAAQERAKLAKNRSPHTVQPAQLLALRNRLQNGSDFGFVALDMAFDNKRRDEPGPRVALHSCHGLFWGCIPEDAPALLMHTGHKRTHLAWIQHRMLMALHGWMQQQSQRTDNMHLPTAAAAAAAAVQSFTASTNTNSSSSSTTDATVVV